MKFLVILLIVQISSVLGHTCGFKDHPYQKLSVVTFTIETNDKNECNALGSPAKYVKIINGGHDHLSNEDLKTILGTFSEKVTHLFLNISKEWNDNIAEQFVNLEYLEYIGETPSFFMTNSGNAIYVNMTRMKIKVFTPPLIEQKTKNLILRQNRLSSWKGSYLQVFPNLKFLDLSYNHFKSILNGMFDSTSLEELNLSYNRISVVDPDSFNSLPNVAMLDLCHNNLDYLPNNLLATQVYLKDLKLAHNRFKSLDNNFFGLPSNIPLSHKNSSKLKINLIGNYFNCASLAQAIEYSKTFFTKVEFDEEECNETKLQLEGLCCSEDTEIAVEQFLLTTPEKTQYLTNHIRENKTQNTMHVIIYITFGAVAVILLAMISVINVIILKKVLRIDEVVGIWYEQGLALENTEEI